MFLQPRTTLLILVFAALLGWVIYDQTRAPQADVAARAAAAPAQPANTARAVRPAGLAQMPQRPPLGDIAGDPFTPRSWQPAQPPQAAATAMGAAAAKPPAPVTPSLPFRFAGRLYQNGGIQTYLARGDDVFPVNVGDALQGGYRVESIGDEKVTLVYLATNTRQDVEMEPPLEAAEGARRNANRTAAMALPGEQAR